MDNFRTPRTAPEPGEGTLCSSPALLRRGVFDEAVRNTYHQAMEKVSAAFGAELTESDREHDHVPPRAIVHPTIEPICLASFP
ncbi:hypothetical protein [Paeniglutamicibacter gangotriensis]|uniref:Uncharacterized protein n=1 Tax=Paeniglutamicibacter gangotriensis Lz1y TaxID=1276920 RepID=M7N015_9MICC|nr:hypothetical protein [Paeniglutamicibacter gangotriensis]EMR00556.1 hypothetical protein ADIAG_00563 [Paeniglutamicibacter gangotriensis Lz1y]